MDIGPINAIGRVTMVRPSPPGSQSSPDPDLSGVFAMEFRNQQPDDSYSPNRKASRGIEDENAEEDSNDFESASSPDLPQSPPRIISFFA